MVAQPKPRVGIDDVATDYAIKFISDNKSKPFVLAIGLKACHSPFNPPKRLASLYEKEKAPPRPQSGNQSALPVRLRP